MSETTTVTWDIQALAVGARAWETVEEGLTTEEDTRARLAFWRGLDPDRGWRADRVTVIEQVEDDWN